MACLHSGGHTATSTYRRDLGYLRFALVCDECGLERHELGTLAYRPRALPSNNGLADRLAAELLLAPDRASRVRLAALVRDVGKANLAPGILAKPGPLDESEWEQVRRHPEFSAMLLAGAAFDDLRGWVRHHHERWDGSGYPDGLSGGEIPLESRILAVVDAYEAMTGVRPYRPTLTPAEACHELWHGAGSQFDLAVVAAFQRALGRSVNGVAA